MDFDISDGTSDYLKTEPVHYVPKEMLDINSSEISNLYKPQNDFNSLNKIKTHKPLQLEKLKLDVSNYTSSVTLQQGTIKYSFPQTSRFDKSYKKPLTEAIYYPQNKVDKSKGASIGYGKKYDLSDVAGKDSPAPGKYDKISQFDKNIIEKRGFILGKRNEHKDKLNIPGPGAYDTNPKNSGKYPITIRKRNDFYYDEDLKQKTCVSPQRYYPSEKYSKQTRFKEIGIGKGQRTTAVNPYNKLNPGPGSHQLPTIFGKSLSERAPLNWDLSSYIIICEFEKYVRNEIKNYDKKIEKWKNSEENWD